MDLAKTVVRQNVAFKNCLRIRIRNGTPAAKRPFLKADVNVDGPWSYRNNAVFAVTSITHGQSRNEC